MYVRFKLILFFLFLNLGNRKILGTDAFCWNCEIKVKKKTQKNPNNLFTYYINTTKLQVLHSSEIFAFKIRIDFKLLILFIFFVLQFIKFLRHLSFPMFDQQYCKLHKAEVEYSAMEGKKGTRLQPVAGVCQRDAKTTSRDTRKPLPVAPSLQCVKWQSRRQCL